MSKRVWILSADGYKSHREPFAFMSVFAKRNGALSAMRSVADHMGDRGVLEKTSAAKDSLEFEGEVGRYSIYSLEVQ